VQGEGGVNVGDPAYLRAAQELCRERGALLIVDEIQTGFGRTGAWFACEHAGLEPDMIALAKGIGAGFPMGALAYTARVRESLFVGAHGSTFGGNPLACAAGLAALATYKAEDIPARARRMGGLLMARLRAELAGRAVVREIRGLGLLVGIELREKVAPYLKALMVEHGVIALPAGPQVLRLLPPLIVDEEEIELAARAVGEVLPQ
jgi:acetylornithine/LysW-gamma-L-lysine aminotransferase